MAKHATALVTAGVGLALCCQPTMASADLLCPEFGAERPAFDPIAPGLPGHAEADRLSLTAQGHITLEGAAIIEKANRQVRGEHITYSRGETRIIEAKQNVWLQTPELSIQADQIWLDLDENKASLEQTRYWLNTPRASGDAARIEQHSATLFSLSQTSFSTCPFDQRDWELQSNTLDIDQEQGRATARHVVFRVADVPVAYTPYLDFPIDGERHSGLLVPTFRQSSQSGFEYRQPYYFNLRPNMDATLTPAYFSKRGFGLGVQLRRLDQTQTGYTLTNELDAFVLPDDRRNQHNRYEYSWESSGQLEQAGRYDLILNRVSDTEFFRDFGNNFNQTSQSHLESRFDYRNRLQNWDLGLQVRRFQTINTNITEQNYPHRIMPRITLGRAFQTTENGRLSVRGAFTRFEHPARQRNQGNRSHLHLSLSERLGSNSIALTPRVHFQSTHYQLDATEDNPARNLSRHIPTFELDGKLSLQAEHGHTGRFQGELTPRLYYAYTPYEEQQTLPLFNTALRTVSYNAYFQPNRFNGPDRIADINALTYGGDWTLIDTHRGTTPLSIRAAQRYYFETTQIAPEIASGSGPVLLEAYSELPSGLHASISNEYNVDENRIERSETRIGYRGPNQRLANLSYYTERNLADDRLNQIDISFATPLSQRISTVGRFGYDLENNRTVQGLIGVGFESCCWRAQFAVQRYLLEPTARNAHNNDDYSTSVSFQIELKGLGNASGMSRFSDDVPGLRP